MRTLLSSGFRNGSASILVVSTLSPTTSLDSDEQRRLTLKVPRVSSVPACAQVSSISLVTNSSPSRVVRVLSTTSPFRIAKYLSGVTAPLDLSELPAIFQTARPDVSSTSIGMRGSSMRFAPNAFAPA